MPRGGFETGRVFGPDLARGIALLGMFAAHVTLDPGENVYDGRSSILFATVAGVSLGLLTGGSRPATGADRTIRRAGVAIRAVVLIGIGVFLTLVIEPPLAVILEYYGFAFLLVLPLLFASPRVLAIAAGAVAAVMPGVVHALLLRTDQEQVPEVIRAFADWLVYGSYPMAIWVAFLLAGLLCARAGLEHRRTQLLMVLGGAGAAVLGYGAAVVLPGVTAEAHSGTPAEVLGSGGVAVAVIGIATLVGDLPGRAGHGIRLVLYPVAAAGAMALTLYVAHAFALSIVRGIVQDGTPDWTYPDATLAVLIAVALVVATAWRLLLGAGPLERALRLLSGLVAPRRRPGSRAA